MGLKASRNPPAPSFDDAIRQVVAGAERKPPVRIVAPPGVEIGPLGAETDPAGTATPPAAKKTRGGAKARADAPSAPAPKPPKPRVAPQKRPAPAADAPPWGIVGPGTRMLSFRFPVGLAVRLEYLGDTTYRETMTSIVLDVVAREVNRRLKERRLPLFEQPGAMK